MRKTALLLASIALAVMLAGGVALAASAGAKDPGNVEARGAALDASLKALVAMRGGPPGVIAVVQRGGDREVHAFGVRNLKRDLPMRPGAHMRQASTSKAFNGAVALSLVDDSDLSLNDTVGEYLPGLPKSWHEITLRQLLNHTSGLPNFTADGDYLAALSANPTDPPAPRKLISYVEDEPLNFEPGSAYEYSNTDNVAVGLMV
jgi:D-alanyl-D-alanine carboxypeptidase